MKNKTYIFVIILLMISIAISIISLVSINSKISSSPASSANNVLEGCQTFSYSSPDAMNIVFFAEKAKVAGYSEYLFGIKPYNSFKNNFNIYYIPTYQPECKLYKDIALYCYSKELIRKASSCPNDYIIVLKEQPYKIRSSVYMNVLSLNSKHPLSVLPHELGHALANLADEYVPASLPRGQKNCVSSCSKFDSETDGCFIGCSKDSYYRSIDRGIMRTLSSNEYGVYDEALIKKQIDSQTSSSLITGHAISDDCSEQKYHLLEANYSSQNNEIKVISRSIQQGCLGGNGYGNFNYSLYDADGNLIIDDTFNPQLIFTDAPGEIEIDGEIYENDGPFMLKLPIVPNAKTLEIIHDDKKTEISLNEIGAIPCKK